MALQTACRVPACPEIIDGRYCKRHRHHRRRTDRRTSARERGYDRTWRKVRDAYLSAHPVCEDPFDRHAGHPPASEEVDHITPLPQGEKHDPDNLRALCRGCHAKRTRLDG